MTPDVIYANLTDGLRQKFYRMREREVRHMPVLGDHEELARERFISTLPAATAPRFLSPLPRAHVRWSRPQGSQAIAPPF